MPRVYSPAGEQLAWIGEAIGEDVETYEIVDILLDDLLDDGSRVQSIDQVLMYTRDGVTWELTARQITD